jgi:hypothetical protein
MKLQENCINYQFAELFKIYIENLSLLLREIKRNTIKVLLLLKNE